MSIKITSKDQVNQLLDKYDYFLFDCDGVLWLGDHLLPSIPEAISLLRSKINRLYLLPIIQQNPVTII